MSQASFVGSSEADESHDHTHNKLIRVGVRADVRCELQLWSFEGGCVQGRTLVSGTARLCFSGHDLSGFDTRVPWVRVLPQDGRVRTKTSLPLCSSLRVALGMSLYYLF